MASEPGRRVYRGTSAVLLLVASGAVALFLLGDAVVRAGVVSAVLLAPWILLAMWAVYVFAFVSCARTDASGIRIRNLLRIIDIPWQQVADIEMVWQLRVRLLDGGTVRSFGGPVAARPGRPRRALDAGDGRSRGGADRDAEIIHEEWESAIGDGRGSGAVRRSWDAWSLAALVVLLAWAVAAVLVTGGPA